MSSSNLTELRLREIIREGVRGDFEEVKLRLGGVEADVGVLKQDVAVLKQDMIFVKNEVSRIGVCFDEMNDNLVKVLESLVTQSRNGEKIDELQVKASENEVEIKITSDALTLHANSRDLHLPLL